MRKFGWVPRSLVLVLGSPWLAVSVASSSLGGVVQAQVGAGSQVSVPALGTLSGAVTDPSGALIRQATVHLQRHAAGSESPSGVGLDTVSDATGRYVLTAAPGVYDVTVAAPGFEPSLSTLTLGLKANRLDVKLTVATATEQVNVTPDSGDQTAASENRSALVFNREQLDTLSSDDSTMQQEVLAMAGGSGDGGAQVYVDGFSGGRFPPKESIREIRINQNPFSTQFEGLGYGRVEIFTKPGGDRFHGAFFSSGNDSLFNARNPYAGSEPPYYSNYARGDVDGPLGKKTSFFVAGDHNDQQNNAVVDAYNPDGSTLTETVRAPVANSSFSLRLDRQVTANNTLTARYEWNQASATNSGVGQQVLPSEGIDTATTTQTLQMSDTQLIGAKIVDETRFQYIRTRQNQSPVSTAATILVQGAFAAGGAPAQALRDNQDRYELQEYLSISHGAHFVRAGGRYRLLRDSNTTNANYQGEFIFPTLAAYRAGTPSEFSLTAGQPKAVLLSGDLGAYAEDEWKLRKDLTLNYGLRLETQNAIPDHFNPAPRAAIAWAVGQTDKHAPKVVLRAGGGIFYGRFDAANILTSVRQNGGSQQTYYVTNPSFYPNIPVPAQLTSTLPTPYEISPGLHVAYESIGGVSAERTLGKIGSVSANWLAVRGVHQYNSLNINAPLPVSGVRPLGTTQNIYQFASDGIEKAQTFYVVSNLHPVARVSLFAFYGARRQTSDTFGAGSFPSQPYNVSADMGPSGLGYRAIGQRLFSGSNVELPWGFSANMFIAFLSRSRFNITTGTDLNGDTQYNDRPAFATNPTAASVIYKTAYGTFDANPQPGEAIIPYNYAKGPRLVFVESSLRKSFRFGPRPAAAPAVAGSKGPVKRPDPRYELSFAVDAPNVLNHVNAGTPVGVLSSPDFGKPNSLNLFFVPATASNRVIYLQTFFRF